MKKTTFYGLLYLVIFALMTLFMSSCTSVKNIPNQKNLQYSIDAVSDDAGFMKVEEIYTFHLDDKTLEETKVLFEDMTGEYIFMEASIFKDAVIISIIQKVDSTDLNYYIGEYLFDRFDKEKNLYVFRNKQKFLTFELKSGKLTSVELLDEKAPSKAIYFIDKNYAR